MNKATQVVALLFLALMLWVFLLYKQTESVKAFV